MVRISDNVNKLDKYNKPYLDIGDRNRCAICNSELIVDAVKSDDGTYYITLECIMCNETESFQVNEKPQFYDDLQET